ncbi:hypothetical protein GGTG_04649 [Gaeumannomyces tritici R3-111a-1]|uniref:PD-(D/E)XK nuclease-like domain-containing protein n=1 Tax=Gaeumannomyces tritici (strain R3-111a-1) TaxID=644352 RepID=J3NTP9_GAET3|nr:hypothetical protein GGTG_04649 [Gaeumannomyces tritici R3-111a-1]EJT79564.1 hypothetical protein GGTG_04649 [Gaeumannomyces tritici R3-111a-1]
MRCSDISLWLGGIEPTDLTASDDARPAKRKRSLGDFHTPPDSLPAGLAPAHEGQVTPKSRNGSRSGRTQDGDADPNETRRPLSVPLGRPLQLRRLRSASSSDITDSSNTHSVESSTTKKRNKMYEIRSGFRVLPFSTRDSRTGDQGALVADFSRISNGRQGFISRTRQRDIEEDAARTGVLEELPLNPYFDAVEGGQRQTGEMSESMESPGICEVRNIHRTAVEYEYLGQDEAAWNAAVHYPLLRLAMGYEMLVDVVPCASATILDDFVPTGTLNGNKVDFCLAFNPRWPLRPGKVGKTTASEAINKVRLQTDDICVNHTDFSPLLESPIAVSIKAKRADGPGTRDAQRQLGIWQVSHWVYLESMASSMDGLDFLPSIHVVGHKWEFTAFSMKDGTPRLWAGFPIGDTTTVFGVYRIIWCLRRLARYSVEKYWPWFNKAILEQAILEQD